MSLYCRQENCITGNIFIEAKTKRKTFLCLTKEFLRFYERFWFRVNCSLSPREEKNPHLITQAKILMPACHLSFKIGKKFKTFLKKKMANSKSTIMRLLSQGALPQAPLLSFIKNILVYTSIIYKIYMSIYKILNRRDLPVYVTKNEYKEACKNSKN